VASSGQPWRNSGRITRSYDRAGTYVAGWHFEGVIAMRLQSISRRVVLERGACALSGAMCIPQFPEDHVAPTLAQSSEETIHGYYAAWESGRWHALDLLLADDFTFTSANNDDHISKDAFKVRCWETQIEYIDRFDLKRIIGSGGEAFVIYECHTKNHRVFRNVEYFRLRDGKVEQIECYFGAIGSFASAASTG
jgi:ketosteroid isomerase-like protein